MKYIHIKIIPEHPSEETGEILIARLGELPFESFSEDEDGISAYMPENVFEEKSVHDLLDELNEDFGIEWHIETIAEQNWNKKWEENYKPVLIAGRVYIRAPFHEPVADAEHEIIIEPKMSFGTAHHETTRQMIELMLDTDWAGKTFLDMGCGTGVLAILAARLGAGRGLAIDNNEWAFMNSRENLTRNAVTTVEPLLGDHQLIGENRFDIILANINRNILLDQMQAYAAALNPGGRIFLSGFYEEDIPILLDKAAEFGFSLKRKRSLNRWVAMEIG